MSAGGACLLSLLSKLLLLDLSRVGDLRQGERLAARLGSAVFFSFFLVYIYSFFLSLSLFFCPASAPRGWLRSMEEEEEEETCCARILQR